jgi:uncharacterized protein YydD (DUF2326 family)
MMNNEHLLHEAPLGVDGEGNILTDERRAQLSVEIGEIRSRLHELRAELASFTERIASESATIFPGNGSGTDSNGLKPILGDLVTHTRELRTEISHLMDILDKKSTTHYPLVQPTNDKD